MSEPSSSDTPVLDLLAAMTADSLEASTLDAATIAYVRLAALVAMDAPAVSYALNLAAASEMGLDVDDVRVDLLRSGRSPLSDPELEEHLARGARELTFTTDTAAYADADFVVIATPTDYDPESDSFDTSSVEAVIRSVAAVNATATMVVKSTVPVGTGEKVRHRLDERGLAHVGYVSNPEFTAEGTAVRDFMEPDRIVVGAFDEADGDAVEGLHRGIEAPVVRSDVASAEMIKLAANAALMTRISFINEIANVSEELGADVSEVARGMGLDDRIGDKFLKAGLGFGGSCFPKDVSALKQLAGNSGYHFQLLTSVIEVNDLQKRRAVGITRARHRLGHHSLLARTGLKCR